MPRALSTALLVVLVVILLVAGAVLLTPVVHRLLVEAGWLAEDKFLKVLRRLLLIPGLVALFLWLKPWKDGGLRSYGLLGDDARPRLFFAAWAATAAVGLGVLAVHAWTGWLGWEVPLDLPKGLRRASRWLVVGFALGVLEEWFFRGWLDRRLGRRLSPAWTALGVAALYAAIHAFKPSRLDVEVTHDAAGAWTGLVWWLEHLVDPVRFGPTFVGLFLFSLVLTAVWRTTRTLWAPIGIHAGGIWLLRSYGAFTDRTPQHTWAGTKELFDGPPLWILLALALLWLTRVARSGRSRADSDADPTPPRSALSSGP